MKNNYDGEVERLITVWIDKTEVISHLWSEGNAERLILASDTRTNLFTCLSCTDQWCVISQKIYKWLKLNVSLDITSLKCIPRPICHRLIGVVMTLTFDLWPWIPLQQCPLTWWIFVAIFTEIGPLSTKISCDQCSKWDSIQYRHFPRGV